MGLTNLAVTVRLLLAALFGWIIGMERHQHGKPVGRRTHAIICISGAMIAIIGLYGFENLDYFTRDPTRLPVGVLTGLGFLGAGVIWQGKGGVKGLTTAATVYVTACIGLTVGFGYYYMAALGTFLIYLILASGRIVSRFDKKNKLENFENNLRANSKDEYKRNSLLAEQDTTAENDETEPIENTENAESNPTNEEYDEDDDHFDEDKEE